MTKTGRRVQRTRELLQKALIELRFFRICRGHHSIAARRLAKD